MLKALLLWATLLVCLPASADVFSFHGGQYVTGNPPGTCSLGSSVGTGQVIIMLQEGGGTATSVTDNLNTGSYSVLYSVASVAQRIFWIVTNATGAPTLTLSGSSGSTNIQCFAITGFVGTPTSDTAIQNRTTGTGVTLAINATSNFSNEVLLVNSYNAGSKTVTVSGWTAAAGTSSFGFYAFEYTSGAVNNFSGTISASEAWYLQLAGIYDSGGSSGPTAQQAASMFLSQ